MWTYWRLFLIGLMVVGDAAKTWCWRTSSSGNR